MKSSTTSSALEVDNRDELFNILLSSLINDTVPEFMDPLTKKLMINPVALSSGLVLDSSAHKDKVMRFCPITKQKLTPFVHPVNVLRDRIRVWNTGRL